MWIDIFTILPEMIEDCVNCYILKRTRNNGFAEIYRQNYKANSALCYLRPDVLLSGNERIIQERRLRQALGRIEWQRLYLMNG